MPRRSRPAVRAPPGNSNPTRPQTRTPPRIASTKISMQAFTTRDDPEDSASESEDEVTSFIEGSSNDARSEIVHPSEDENEEADPDAPRVSQWMDDEDLDGQEGSDEEKEEDSVNDEQGNSRNHSLSTLQDGLSELPLGSLRKAQRALALATADSDDENASSNDSAAEETSTRPPRPEKGKEKEWSTAKRTDIAKRANKHAPTEVTSKRPVTRRRQVVEVPKLEARDPRFIPLSGSFDAKRFGSQYNFLSDLHNSEAATLLENLKRARKQLTSSPRDLRDERVAEVSRLEGALKRAESTVNRDRRERVEREAMERVAKEEKERRKQGKGVWFMKDADKKQLLVKARYDALAESGGRGAVRKAIEKKQKKIGQKEKKKRPFVARSEGGGGSFSAQRGAAGNDDHRPAKRPRRSE